MTEQIKDIHNFFKWMGTVIIISDEQKDETGHVVKEPVLVIAGGGERIGYIPIEELRRWLDQKIPSEITKALTEKKDREETFVIEDYGREYLVGQDHMHSVRYSAWRLDRPNVKGYGKTPDTAIYDLTHNVQPL